jgi:hypothetical protein
VLATIPAECRRTAELDEVRAFWSKKPRARTPEEARVS